MLNQGAGGACSVMFKENCIYANWKARVMPLPARVLV